MLPILLGALLSACAAAPTAPPHEPVGKVTRVDGAVNLVILVPKAVERIGIKTEPVREVVIEGRRSKAVSYAALVYDTRGDTFVYTNPASLTYARRGVRLKSITGDLVVLADGPPAGAAVVTVGASQLLGIELGIGS